MAYFIGIRLKENGSSYLLIVLIVDEEFELVKKVFEKIVLKIVSLFIVGVVEREVLKISTKEFGFINEGIEDFQERKKQEMEKDNIITQDTSSPVFKVAKQEIKRKKKKQNHKEVKNHAIDLKRKKNNIKNSIDLPLFRETKRLTTHLNLQDNEWLIQQINNNAKLYYKELPYRSGLRNAYILAPVAIYLTCLENSLFINLKQLYRNSDCTQVQFNQALHIVLKKNKNLYIRLHSDEFRKNYIYHILDELSAHFCFPDEFLDLGQHYLSDYFLKLKHKKDTVIAALIFFLCRETLGDQLNGNYAQVCKYLGIGPSVISTNKKILKENLHEDQNAILDAASRIDQKKRGEEYALW